MKEQNQILATEIQKELPILNITAIKGKGYNFMVRLNVKHVQKTGNLLKKKTKNKTFRKEILSCKADIQSSLIQKFKADYLLFTSFIVI